MNENITVITAQSLIRYCCVILQELQERGDFIRIGFISDLHVDHGAGFSDIAYLNVLKGLIEEEQIDMLIIGGDISNHYETTLQFVENLQWMSGVPIYFLPGNHDFWEINAKKKDANETYKLYKNHPQSLLENPLSLPDNRVIVGHTGWYNHVVHANRFTENEIEKGQYKGALWQDKSNVDWQETDKEVSKRFSEIVKKELEEVKGKSIILVTHVVTLPEFTMPMPHEVFDFFNAYLATDDFLPLIEEYEITHSIMGHFHSRRKTRKGKTNFVLTSAGYPYEWRTRNLREELRSALYVIDLKTKQ